MRFVYHISGRIIVDVEDDIPIEVARELADEAVGEADFGGLSHIEWDFHHAETDDGMHIEN